MKNIITKFILFNESMKSSINKEERYELAFLTDEKKKEAEDNNDKEIMKNYGYHYIFDNKKQYLLFKKKYKIGSLYDDEKIITVIYKEDDDKQIVEGDKNI